MAVMQLRRSGFDWVLEIVSLAAVAATFAVVAVHWSQLPAQVPRHFGPLGQANSWGQKSGIWLIPVVSLVTYFALTFASTHQALVNLPLSVDRGKPEVRRIVFRLVNVLKAVLTTTFLYISWTSVNAALGAASGLGAAFLPVTLAATFVPLVLYIRKLSRYRT